MAVGVLCCPPRKEFHKNNTCLNLKDKKVDVELHLATYTNLLPYVEDVEFHINSSTTVLSQFPAWTI
jgi:hypothetical protein